MACFLAMTGSADSHAIQWSRAEIPRRDAQAAQPRILSSATQAQPATPAQIRSAGQMSTSSSEDLAQCFVSRCYTLAEAKVETECAIVMWMASQTMTDVGPGSKQCDSNIGSVMKMIDGL